MHDRPRVGDAVSGIVRVADGELNVRSGPGTNYTIVAKLSDGAQVWVVCQATGTTENGTYGSSNVWNGISAGGYVADTFVDTGHPHLIPGMAQC